MMLYFQGMHMHMQICKYSMIHSISEQRQLSTPVDRQSTAHSQFTAAGQVSWIAGS